MWGDHLDGANRQEKNTELNSCGIIASPDVPNIEMLEPAGDKRTQIPPKKGIQVERILRCTYVEFMHPLTSLPTICNTQYIYIPILF